MNQFLYKYPLAMYVPTAMVWLIGKENVFKVLLLIFYVILIKMYHTT